ncbi:MAG: hypothetical protein Phog2KO_04680 [Phototrophicaceae bacterium]
MAQSTKQVKRVLNALKRLRSDTQYMIPMEMYDGMGNVLTKTYHALHQSAKAISDDSFLDALEIDLPPNASDRQVAIQVNVLVGQLLAYIEDLYAELDSEDSSLTGEEQTRQRFNNMMDDN